MADDEDIGVREPVGASPVPTGRSRSHDRGLGHTQRRCLADLFGQDGTLILPVVYKKGQVRPNQPLDQRNGPIEGANTKVKFLRRQMCGRAGSALLRQRILLA